MTDKFKVHKTLQNLDMRISYREGFMESEQIFENHCHTRYEMIAVFEGKVSIVVDNRKFTLKAGEIAIIPPLAYHSVYGGAEIMYKRATALFEESVIPKEIISDFKEKTTRQPISTHGLFLPLFENLKSIFTFGDGEKFLPLVNSLLVEALYIHTYKDTSGKKEKSHPTIKAATEYIDAHITKKMTLDDIAEGLFLSKSTLSHLFRSEMKISVKQYILQKKLAYAAKLISEGIGATSAAERIGYDNYANFYKMYKKVFGCSPRANAQNRQ